MAYAESLGAAAAADYGGGTPRKRKLTLPGLVAIIFYSVCGGPFGSEDVVSAAGPLFALLGFLLLPLVWSIPEALVTAELSTAFPGNAGFVTWVTAAFGPACGFLEGFLSWISAATDSAIYPVLFCDYLKHVWPPASGGIARTACVAAFSLLLNALNFLGADISGWSAFALSVFTLLPFLYVVPAGLAQAEPANFLIRPALQDVDWSVYLNVLFWNLNYWDTASTVAGEVRKPEWTFPTALWITVLIVIATYLLPIAAGVGLSGKSGGQDWASWGNGTLALIGERVGGQAVKVWVVSASAVSQAGQFLSEQAAASYQLQGMAELGWLPRCFARRSPLGTPTAGLLLCLSVTLVLSTLDFLAIVDFVSMVYCMAQLLEFAAFVQLRRAHPELRRPFRLPLRHWASCAAMLLPAMVLAVVILAMPFAEKDWTQVVYLLALPVAGVLLHHLLEVLRARCPGAFSCSPPRDLAALLALGAGCEGSGWEEDVDESSDLAESSAESAELSASAGSESGDG